MIPDLGIAVFARTPGSGGKTRLAASWGRARTDLFYDHCLRCAADWLKRSPEAATGYWALTGPGPRDAACWQGLPILEQGDGGLGERMARVARLLHARHGFWCLVGTDIPQMSPPNDLRLGRRLAESELLFGPAADGGFWLVGGRRLPPRRLWSDIPYSRPDTLSLLLAALRQAMPGAAIDTGLPILHDIDRQADLARLLPELEQHGDALTPAQQDLLHWLRCETTPALSPAIACPTGTNRTTRQ